MNAHQRRKARRAKDRDLWPMAVFPDAASALAHATLYGSAFYRVSIDADVAPLLTGEIGTYCSFVRAGIPLIRGEIGTIER